MKDEDYEKLREENIELAMLVKELQQLNDKDDSRIKGLEKQIMQQK